MYYFWWGCRGNLKLITLESERVDKSIVSIERCAIRAIAFVLIIWPPFETHTCNAVPDDFYGKPVLLFIRSFSDGVLSCGAFDESRGASQCGHRKVSAKQTNQVPFWCLCVPSLSGSAIRTSASLWRTPARLTLVVVITPFPFVSPFETLPHVPKLLAFVSWVSGSRCARSFIFDLQFTTLSLVLANVLLFISTIIQGSNSTIKTNK